jgi:hypothetical protein
VALILKHVLDNMQDTLGGGEIPASLDAIGILNQAGEHLHSMHAWRWAQGRSALLSTRGSVTGTAATWTPGTLTLTKASAFTNYTFVAGDELEITGGTGVTEGFYTVASRTSANAVVLSSSIASTAPTDVAFTLQPFSIDLPDDLRDIISIVGTGAADRHMVLSTLAEVLRAREEETSNDYHWYGAVSYVGTPPTPILEIAPGAGSSITGAFRMFYRARWARLTSDSASVVVPEFCEALFLQIARAFARGYVREDSGSLSSRLAEIESGPVFSAAMRSDGAIQPFFGRLRGGGPMIHRRMSSDFFETVSRINGPI